MGKLINGEILNVHMRRHCQDVNCQVPKNCIYNSLQSQLTSQQAFLYKLSNGSNMYAETEMSLKAKIILKVKTKSRGIMLSDCRSFLLLYWYEYQCDKIHHSDDVQFKWFNPGANGI